MKARQRLSVAPSTSSRDAGIDRDKPIPAKTALSEEISKALKKRGFKFVGPTIVYAWMQAIGIVNDHSADCFRRGIIRKMGRQ